MFSTPLPKSSDIPQVDPQSPQDYIFHTPGDYPGYQNPANSSHPPFISRSIQLDAYVPSANPATKKSIRKVTAGKSADPVDTTIAYPDASLALEQVVDEKDTFPTAVPDPTARDAAVLARKLEKAKAAVAKLKEENSALSEKLKHIIEQDRKDVELQSSKDQLEEQLRKEQAKVAALITDNESLNLQSVSLCQQLARLTDDASALHARNATAALAKEELSLQIATAERTIKDMRKVLYWHN